MRERPGDGTRPLVVGVGNRERGDDGIGPAIVEVLRRRRADIGTGTEAAIDTVIAAGDLSTLPLRWRDAEHVVIVDACRSGRPAGTLVRLGPADLTHPGTVSSHGVGVAFALGLAARLGWLPRRLDIVGIEAGTTDGDALSPAVAARVEHLADQVTALVAAADRPGPERTG